MLLVESNIEGFENNDENIAPFIKLTISLQLGRYEAFAALISPPLHV